MKKNKKIKDIELKVKIAPYRISLFSFTFLGTILLIFILQISLYLNNFWLRILIEIIGWIIWITLTNLGVNRWLRKKARVRVIVK